MKSGNCVVFNNDWGKLKMNYFLKSRGYSSRSNHDCWHNFGRASWCFLWKSFWANLDSSSSAVTQYPKLKIHVSRIKAGKPFYSCFWKEQVLCWCKVTKKLLSLGLNTILSSCRHKVVETKGEWYICMLAL